MRWGDNDPAVFRGEDIGVGVFDVDDTEDARPTELCFGDPYGLALGVVDDVEVRLLPPMPGLALFPDVIILDKEALDGDEEDEGGLDDDLTGGPFLGLCGVGVLGVLCVLLGGRISRGSLEDFCDRCNLVFGAGGRALDGRGRRAGTLVSLLEPLDKLGLAEPRPAR